MSEFLPLMAPRVSPDRSNKEPVSWFEVIAKQLPSARHMHEADTAVQTGEDGVACAQFGSIDSVIASEQMRRSAGEPEPEYIVKMREAAMEDASRIVSEAWEQAQSIREESRAQGYKAGYEAGHAAGERDTTQRLTRQADEERAAYQQELNAFIQSIEEKSRLAWIEMEPEIVALVFEIARKVIKMEVEISHDPAIEVVKNTLRRVADSTSLRIRVHSDDLLTVRAHREDLYALVDSIRKVEIVEDRRVGRGGCIVETDAGTIDARIDTQLDEIRKLLEHTTPGIDT